MKLTACMIVKNEIEMLQRTLPDLVKSVDEVILVDTGSSDGTVAFAQACGARVFHFAWINDFAAARNASLKHATGDWILWIDADEYIKPEDFSKLKNVLLEAPSDVFRLKIQECPIGTLDSGSFYYRYKVFRNHRGFHFERAINEQVYDGQGKLAAGEHLINSVPVYHWGNYKSEDKMLAKKERNISLLLKLQAQAPNDSAAPFLLASNYYELKRFEAAAACYQRALELKPDHTIRVGALSQLAWCYYNLKRMKEAHQAALQALRLNANDAAALNVMGAILLSLGETDKSIQFFEHSKQVPLPDKDEGFVSLNQKEYVANFFLGSAYLQKGENAKAKEAFLLAAKRINSQEVNEKLRDLQCR